MHASGVTHKRGQRVYLAGTCILTNEGERFPRRLAVAQTTTKVLKAQGEYWHAGHLAELLIEAEHFLRRVLEGEFPEAGLNEAATRKCEVPEEAMRLVKEFVRDCTECRPNLGKHDPILAAVNKEFEELCTAYVGRKITDLFRRIAGRLLECVSLIQNWIVTLSTTVEEVTERPAFEWLELASTLTDSNVPLDGADGRHARLRRVIGMLDSVVALGDSNRYCVADLDKIDAADADKLVGVGVCIDQYTLEYEAIDPKTDKTTSQSESMDSQEKPELAVPSPDLGLKKPPEQELKVDSDSRCASWGDKQLAINSAADFNLLKALYVEAGKVVPYTTLRAAVKPDTVSGQVKTIVAPPEVREAVSHVNKAFKSVECRFQVVCARKYGYRLQALDE